MNDTIFLSRERTTEEKLGVLMDYCRDHSSCGSCIFFDGASSTFTHQCDNWNEDSELVETAYLYLIEQTAKKAAEEAMAEYDMVNHPGHYESGKFECIDVMLETQGKEAVMGFCICNAFKYLYRHNRKNGIEDVKKAVWYLNKYLELAEEE